jgi:hypothetical protein
MGYRSRDVRAGRVKEIVSQQYVPGRQSKSKSAIYRNVVFREEGISKATFDRYLKGASLPEKVQKDDNQLSIPFSFD